MPQLTRKMNNLAAVPTIASVTACSSRGAKQLIRFSDGSMFTAAAFENHRTRDSTWPARSSFSKGMAPALPEWSDNLLIL